MDNILEIFFLIPHRDFGKISPFKLMETCSIVIVVVVVVGRTPLLIR